MTNLSVLCFVTKFGVICQQQEQITFEFRWFSYKTDSVTHNSEFISINSAGQMIWAKLFGFRQLLLIDSATFLTKGAIRLRCHIVISPH